MPKAPKNRPSSVCPSCGQELPQAKAQDLLERFRSLEVEHAQLRGELVGASNILEETLAVNKQLRAQLRELRRQGSGTAARRQRARRATNEE